MSKKVLNSFLYKVLRKRFGEIRIHNRGMRHQHSLTQELDGTQTLVTIHSGEEYAVCCPFCHDTRFRLSVNHMFGQRIGKVDIRDAAYCFNEKCPQVIQAVQDAIMEELDGELGDAPAVQSEAQSIESLEDVVAFCQEKYTRLTNYQPLTDLDPCHPAREYLLCRRFDPDNAYKWYKLGFSAGVEPKLAKDRLIFPLSINGTAVGYQAREIPDYTKTWKGSPKYWTSAGTRKSFFLFNYDLAKKHDFVILVEGPTDVMRIGPPAVAILGKCLGMAQLELIVDTWPSGPVILIGDPGFEDDWTRNLEMVRDAYSHVKRNVRLLMPEITDPGDMTYAGAWKYIEENTNVRKPDIGYDVSVT